MSLISLKVIHMRNLAALELSPSLDFNLIYGANGSGKSSILESIYFLSLGRSFRSHLVSRVINYQQDNLAIFGLVKQNELSIPIGIEKYRQGKIKVKVNNEITHSVAELVKILPLQLINPDSYYLLSAGPRERRQFLDWGVFHVEPKFFTTWQRLQRLIKQRNAALQQKLSIQQIRVWDNEFINLSKEITEFRQSYIDQFKPIVFSLLQELIQINDLSIDYYQGWNSDKNLEQVLADSALRDMALGYTQYGPQRADLLLKVKNIPVEDVLSRGEQKLFICALQLAQGILLKQITEKNCVYLLDDIAAELDSWRRQCVIDVLAKLQAQVFITAVDKESLGDLTKQVTVKSFHVKQGQLAAD